MTKRRKLNLEPTDNLSLLPRDLLLPTKNNKISSSITSVGSESDAIEIMAKLSNTCREPFYTLFKPELEKRGAKKLLEYVLRSNEDNKNEPLKIAKTNPRLFFIKATALDYAMDFEGNRRTIKDWSPYQALFGTGDKEMLRTLKPYLDAYLKTLPNGNELAASQEQEKFPNGFDYPASTNEFQQLINELALAIDKDEQLRQTGKTSETTFKLLAQFRKNLKPESVETGHHYNINDFLKTHEIYEQYWNPWNENQCTFFSVNVIGFQERLMSAPFLQLTCMGLDEYWKKEQTLKRDFEVINYVSQKKITVTPFTAEDPSCRLGEDFVVIPRYGRAEFKFVPSFIRRFETFVKQTQWAFEAYAHTAETNEPLMLDRLK